MKILKLSLITLTFFMLSDFAFGQVRFGAKANLGSSWISSGNLKSNLESRMNRDVDIKEWNASYRPGIMFGIGGVANYLLTNKLSLQGELSFNYQQSNIKISYLADDRGQGGTGTIEKIDSEAKIFSTRFSVPVTLYDELGLDKPVLLAGLEGNFLNTPQIESIDSEVVRDLENGTLVAEQKDAEAIIGDLDMFSNLRFNFLLGAAKSVELAENKISI